MAKLTFFTIFMVNIGIGEDEVGGDIYDRFWPGTPGGVGVINLGDVDTTRPALLQFLTRGVHNNRNFVTWNAPRHVTSLSYPSVALDHPDIYVVGTVKANLSDSRNSWTQNTLEIAPNKLSPGTENHLGIHTRNAAGDVHGDRDNFGISNIYLFYYLRETLGPVVVTPIEGTLSFSAME